MATATMPGSDETMPDETKPDETKPGAAKSNPAAAKRRAEHLFFSGLALLMLATVYIGFARTYFNAGLFTAPLPHPIIHVHGAAFSLWILLLVAQTSLVNAGRTDLHRKLGVAGFVLACLMAVLGTLAAVNGLERGAHPPGIDGLTFFMVPMSAMAVFSVLVYFAWRMRRDPASHKRLLIFATTELLLAATARWPVYQTAPNLLPALLTTYFFILALLLFDLWSLRRVHKVTAMVSVAMLVFHQVRMPLATTSGWHAFAAWVLEHGQWMK